MKNRKKNIYIPDHIILKLLNQETDAEKEVLDHYDGYIREVATEPVTPRTAPEQDTIMMRILHRNYGWLFLRHFLLCGKHLLKIIWKSARLLLC